MDLVSHPRTLLPNDEPEVGELIRRWFEQEGLRLHLGFMAVRASAGRLLAQGTGETRELPYDALLLGTGRKANVEHLDLGAAGVHVARDGVEVDEYLCTSNPNTYAIGMQPSRRSSRTRPMRQRGSVSRTRWTERIVRHESSSFPTAPTPIPRWPRWA